MEDKRDPLHVSPPQDVGAPPAYDVAPPTADSTATDITAAFARLELDSKSSEPSIDECIAHLKLLEAFNHLREDIATQDGLYGINDSFVPASDNDQLRSRDMAKVREKRWAIFVTIAVKRFEAYFQTLQPGSTMTNIETMNDYSYERIVDVREAIRFDTDSLPPLGEGSRGDPPKSTNCVKMSSWFFIPSCSTLVTIFPTAFDTER